MCSLTHPPFYILETVLCQINFRIQIYVLDRIQ